MLDGFRVETMETVAQVAADRPDFYVLDATYAQSVDPETGMGALLARLRGETLGYRLALRYRSPTPWGWLPGALSRARRRGRRPVPVVASRDQSDVRSIRAAPQARMKPIIDVPSAT